MSYPPDAAGQHRIGQATDLPPNTGEQVWLLRLYVAGQSTCSLIALANLMNLCRQRLSGRHQLRWSTSSKTSPRRSTMTSSPCLR